MTSTNRLLAEGVGMFWVVFAGCGAAVLGVAFPQLGIGVCGVSMAFGLTVVTMAYAIGHISCQLNPAVSVGLMLSNRFPARELPGYIAAKWSGRSSGPGRALSYCQRGGPPTAGTARLGRNESRRGGHARWGRLSSERRPGADTTD